MNLQSLSLHVKYIWIALFINFCVLIYIAYLVISNQDLINQNKKMITTNKQVLSTQGITHN
jgi:hypothetical protein